MKNARLIEIIKKAFPEKGILSQEAKLALPDLKKFSDEMRRFLEFSDKSQNVNQEPPLILVNIDERFNARSIKDGEIEIISISHGAILIIYKFFHMLMSRKEFLPHIGDSGLEEDKEIILNEIPSEIAALNYGILKPKCPKRLVYAEFMCKVAFWYIFGHEIAHIRRGHLSSDLGSVLFEEFDADYITVKNRDEMIEIDADSISACLCTQYLYYISTYIDKNSENSWVFEDSQKLIELFGISILVTNFLFSHAIEWIFDPNSVKKYPPPLARTANLSAILGHFCEEVFGMNFSEIEMEFKNNRDNFYQTLFSIISPELKGEIKSQTVCYIKEYQNYLKGIHSKRHRLTDLLGENVLYRNIDYIIIAKHNE